MPEQMAEMIQLRFLGACFGAEILTANTNIKRLQTLD